MLYDIAMGPHAMHRKACVVHHDIAKHPRIIFEKYLIRSTITYNEIYTLEHFVIKYIVFVY